MNKPIKTWAVEMPDGSLLHLGSSGTVRLFKTKQSANVSAKARSGKAVKVELYY